MQFVRVGERGRYEIETMYGMPEADGASILLESMPDNRVARRTQAGMRRQQGRRGAAGCWSEHFVFPFLAHPCNHPWGGEGCDISTRRRGRTHRRHFIYDYITSTAAR